MVDSPVLSGHGRHALVCTGRYWHHFWNSCRRDRFSRSRSQDHGAERRQPDDSGNHHEQFGILRLSKSMVGDYTVIVEMKGFQKLVQTGIRLNAADHLSLPVRLSLGEVAQSVQVSGDAPQALALEPSTGGTVTSSQMQQLEVNGRNPVYLAGLEPGVTGTNIGTFDPDSVSSGAFSINGARTDAYTVYVDGAVATRTRSSGSMLGAQDMSSVQELQVLTGYFDAEYGRSAGGQIRFVTKSGTSTYHGQAYEVVRNAVFDANTWSRNASPLAEQNSKPPKQDYN